MVPTYSWAFSSEICHWNCVSLKLKTYLGGKEACHSQAGRSQLLNPFQRCLPLACWDVFSETAQHHYSPCFLGKKSRKPYQEVVLHRSLTGLHEEHTTVGFGPPCCFCFIFLAMSYSPSACYSFPMKNPTFTNHQVNDSSLLHLWIRLKLATSDRSGPGSSEFIVWACTPTGKFDSKTRSCWTIQLIKTTDRGRNYLSNRFWTTLNARDYLKGWKT